jgi:hypothetical protein
MLPIGYFPRKVAQIGVAIDLLGVAIWFSNLPMTRSLLVDRQGVASG